jgi:hypothetical protein
MTALAGQQAAVDHARGQTRRARAAGRGPPELRGLRPPPAVDIRAGHHGGPPVVAGDDQRGRQERICSHVHSLNQRLQWLSRLLLQETRLPGDSLTG